MAVTMLDVAKKAGVALGTVSRYFNGYNLREDNRIKIERAIEELGFKENFIARALKNNRSMTIGVLIASLTDIFSTSIVSVLEGEAAQENYSVIICDYLADARKLEEKIDFLIKRAVDGIIFFAYNGSEYEEQVTLLERCMAQDIPVVVINDDMPDLDTDKVLVDNANASFRAIERLIHMNHKKIAIINGPKNVYTSKERYKGYEEALQVYSIEARDEWIKWGEWGDVSDTHGYQAMKELLSSSDRPTAVYVTNYYMTLGAMMAVYEMNVSVPDEVSIIGFDYFKLSDIIRPALTVIQQPTEVMGRTAAQLLLKRIKRDYGDFPVQQLIHTKMLLRDSVKGW